MSAVAPGSAPAFADARAGGGQARPSSAGDASQGTPDLGGLRQEIDLIDRQISDLFARRMEVSSRVALSKAGTGKPVFDPARERQVLATAFSRAPQGLGHYAAALFSTLMELSRSRQQSLLGQGREQERMLKDAMSRTPACFPATATVACQGVEGAYSQHACDRLFQHPSVVYVDSFEAVFRAVEQGMSEFGVVPLENSTAGSVNRVFDLMMGHEFFIARTVRVKVDHCLLAPPGTRADQVRTVFSHPQALAQCSRYLAQNLQAAAVPVENTALAARMVAEGADPSCAAISSRACARLYGLDQLAGAIQDDGANFTRFACIAATPRVFPGADRATVALTTPHRPGALCQVLQRLAALDVNVSKLESRPIPGRDFEFMFYLDLEVPAADPRLVAALSQAAPLCEEFRFLGCYGEVA